jgi:predicted lipid-binding transport protein (Tim44 family)
MGPRNLGHRSMMNFLSRRGRTLALAGVLALAFAGVAEARKGSFGSRGSRTFDPPAATRTAPGSAQPMQRTQTTPSQVQQQRPTAPTGATQPAGRFGGGFFAGLLGAGLLGALFGAGLFGGLGSLASILGFVLQLALIVGVVMLVMRFIRGRRQQPAYAGAAPGQGSMQRSALGGLGAPLSGGAATGAGLGAATAAPVRRERSDEIGVGGDDYAAFETTLQEILDAYSREDVARIWTLATPEMAGYFQEELNDSARDGVINRISDVRLLSGDLAEAWREGSTDYATVAMRYALVDATLDRTTGRVVDGDRDRPVELTEIWTFRRDNGGPSKVSAIQKTA